MTLKARAIPYLDVKDGWPAPRKAVLPLERINQAIDATGEFSI